MCLKYIQTIEGVSLFIFGVVVASPLIHIPLIKPPLSNVVIPIPGHDTRRGCDTKDLAEQINAIWIEPD